MHRQRPNGENGQNITPLCPLALTEIQRQESFSKWKNHPNSVEKDIFKNRTEKILIYPVNTPQFTHALTIARAEKKNRSPKRLATNRLN